MKRQLIENGGTAVEGMLLSSMYYFAEDKPRLNAFKQNFQTRFGEPADMAAVFGYEAVLTLKAGLEKASALTPEAIKQAVLETGIVPGLNGDFPIDRYGDPARTSYMYVVTDGTFQIKTRI
jgi:branched-chain amino acid transport system substrate-binding protein